MPRIRILIPLILLATVRPSNAGAAAPTDGAVLDSLLSSAVCEFAAEAETQGRPVRLDAPASILAIAEAAVSRAGFFLAGAESEGGWRIAVSTSGIRRTLVRRGREFDRHVSLTVHLTCAGQSGTIFSARRIEREYTGRLSRTDIDSTDSAGTFEEMAGRRVVIGAPGRLRATSFLVLTATLGWFASQE